MRDNLIFTGIAETTDSYEDTEKVLKNFIKDELKHDPEKIDFKRIHRIGARRSRSDKPRSIIAKFNVTSQRDLIKRSGKELKGKSYRIFEQFPEEVSEYRRNVLYPLQFEARKNNKRAHIIVDRLYIDNVQQKVKPPPPYRVPGSQKQNRLVNDR